MARFSTHVLDVSRGAPAEGVVIHVHILEGDRRKPLATGATNRDGRTDPPLLSTPLLPTGVYELAFFVGDYFRRMGVPLTDPPFLDVVIVRVGVADAAGHYHVPLLISPYGYSTYRGS